MFARGLFFLFQRFLPPLLFFLPRLFFLPPFGVFDRVLDLLPCELDLFRCWPLPGDLDGDHGQQLASGVRVLSPHLAVMLERKVRVNNGPQPL